jgi:hypothetical protein
MNPSRAHMALRLSDSRRSKRIIFSVHTPLRVGPRPRWASPWSALPKQLQAKPSADGRAAQARSGSLAPPHRDKRCGGTPRYKRYQIDGTRHRQETKSMARDIGKKQKEVMVVGLPHVR